MHIKRRSFIAVCIISLYCVFPACGLKDSFTGTAAFGIHYEAAMEWDKELFTVTATVSLKTEGAMPSARNRAEKKVDDALPVILKEAFSSLRVDNYRFGKDVFYENPEMLARISDICTPEKKQYARLAADLSVLSVTYAFSLYPDIISVFIEHEEPIPLSPALVWEPSSGKFSGILIYAPRGLPVYGEEVNANLTPCLFPKIYDSKTNLIASPAMLAPEVLMARGFSGYAISEYIATKSSQTEDHEGKIQKRVGQSPLRILARGIFGTNRTDLILHDESVRTILSRQENIDLIRQGKIMIIVETD